MGKGDQLFKSSDEMRLSELMRKAQEGDSDSYRILLVEIEKMVASYVKNSFRRLGLGQQAWWEDVCQEVLLAIHNKRSTFNPQQNFLPWLYSIAKYKVIDYFRSVRVSAKHIDLQLDIAELEIAEIQNNDSNVGHDLEVLFNELPDKQRKVLQLVKIEGLSITEAAAKTGFSNSDVKVTIHRAIKFLQKRMQDEKVLSEKSRPH